MDKLLARQESTPAKAGESKVPTTPVKSTRKTQSQPAIPRVTSISAIAALKEPALWTRKRVIIVTAVGATAILLLAITGSLMRRHATVSPSGLSKAAEPKLADQGDAAAQYNLGVQYEDGQGVPQDLGKAAELYQKAANQGHAAAQYNLALLYAHGEGVPQDLGKAAELYQKAANQGHAAAQNNLGLLYEHGEGVPKDLGKAVELYQKAADQGNTVAKNHLADAQNHLGWLYENGQGVPKDWGKAAELYQKAADQGNAKAQYNLGLLYEGGQGVPKDLKKAAELYQKAANQGDQDAIANLKTLSKPAEPNLTDQGDAAAQNNLGEQYEYGRGGFTKDFGKAAELYEKAADQGNARAQNNLGWLYENGWGVTMDLEKAVELYQKAANQGNQAAIANLKRVSGHEPSAPSSRSEFTGGYDPAIATVDMQRIFKAYEKTKTAEAKINDAKTSAKKEYDDRAEAYKKALDEINNLNQQLDDPALSAELKTRKAKERDDKIANIKNMEREINEFRQTRERQLQEQAMRMREGIVKEITDKIRELGGDVANIIFDRSGMSINGVPLLMYSPARGDMSGNVIQALNDGSHSTFTTIHNLKMGAVDMQRAFKEYNKTKDAEVKINDAKNSAKKEYDDRTEAYKKALDEIKNLNKQLNDPALSAELKTRKVKERNDKIANIKNMEREINEFRQTRERQLQEQAMRMREGIAQEITDVVMNAVKTHDIDAVLDISGVSLNGVAGVPGVPVVIYRQGVPDFTDEAVAKLNGTRSSSNMLASGESSRPLRFGVVDMNRAFKAWPETKAAEAKINDEKAAAKNEYASQSPAEREKRDKQIEEDAKKVREPIVAKIVATVNTCAERAGLNLVFDSSGNSINGVPVVVFARELPDLTNAVLKEHDRSH
jgi:TPR repeat protein